MERLPLCPPVVRAPSCVLVVCAGSVRAPPSCVLVVRGAGTCSGRGGGRLLVHVVVGGRLLVHAVVGGRQVAGV